MANFNASYDEIRTALSYINSQSRDVWVKVGTALKTEFGEAGFSLFDEWSKTANNYKSDDAKSAYKSFRRGMSNIGYVINQAKQNGWVREKPQAISQAEILERQRKNQELARQAEIERQQKATEAAIYAQKVWNNAKPANPNHAYLQSKGIDNPSVLASIRQDKDALILPLKNHGKIVGIQKIFESGDKRFNRDIEKKGSAFIIGDRADMKHGFLMAEGFATAATLHQATGKPVVVAFDAGNLKDVANNLKGFVEKHHTTVLICADKDDNKTGEVKALNAKDVLGNNAKVIMPDFSDVEIQNFQTEHNGKNPTDFNDLQAISGIERVKNALADTFKAELQNKLLINFYGSPATGKTWTAQNLTAQLQALGVNCEYVSEYATELIKAGRQDELKDQVKVTGEQLRREQEAFTRTNLVITDSPTALGIIYAPEHQKAALHDIAAESDKIPHINILLRHDYESLATFSTNGRIHGKEQSLAIQDKLIEMLKGKYPIHHQRAIPLEELINNIRTSQEWQRFAEHNNINLPRFDIDMDGTALGRQPETFSGSLNVAENDTLHAEKTAESITMNDEMPKPERSAWGDFPPVIRNGDIGELKNEPEYNQAKAGDIVAAGELVNRLIKRETLEQIQTMIGDRKPIIVAVVAEEAMGNNAIPRATAQAIGRELGLSVDTSIRQINKVARTGKTIDHRLAFQPVFGGEVQQGKDYLIVDDTLAAGGTIASLKGYIENRGGKVVGAMAMTARESSLVLPVTQKMLDNIERRHGNLMNEFWQKEFGYGIDKLTNGEAGHLRKAPNVEQIRTRIVNAKTQGGFSVFEQTLPKADIQSPSGEKALNPDDEKPRPPQGGFVLPENSFRQPEQINPKENLMATNDKKLLMDMLDSSNTELRKNAALNEMADDEVLRKAYQDKDESVRLAAVRNPNASSEFLQDAFNDAFLNEKEAILNHPNANEELFKEALVYSSDDSVINTAREHLQNKYGWDDERFVALEQERFNNLSRYEQQRLQEEQSGLKKSELTAVPPLEKQEWQPDTFTPDEWQPEQPNGLWYGDSDELITAEEINKPQSLFATPQEKANAVFEELKTHYQGYGEYNSKDSVMYLPNGKNAEMLHFDPTQERIVLSAINPETKGREEIADTHFTDLDPQHIALAVDKDYKEYQQIIAQNQGKFPDEEQKKNIDKAGDSVEEAIRTAKSKTTTLLPPEAPPSDLSERYNVVERKFLDTKTNLRLTHRVDYVDSENGKTVLFTDKGSKLTTAKNDPQTAADMVEVAKAKGWTTLKLSGNKEFKRQAWLAAESQGIKTKGYSPSPEDKAMLEKLREQRSLNTMEQGKQKQEKSPEKAQSQPEKVSENQPTAPKGGILLEHGKAPYQNDPKNIDSYYAKVQFADGKEKTFWGVGLQDAIENSGAKVGDRISLNSTGKETVRMRVDKDENGKEFVSHNPAVPEKNFERNQWQLTIHEKAQEVPKEQGQPETAKQDDLPQERLIKHDLMGQPERNPASLAQKADEAIFGKRLDEDASVARKGVYTALKVKDAVTIGAGVAAGGAVGGAAAVGLVAAQNYAIDKGVQTVEKTVDKDGKTFDIESQKQQIKADVKQMFNNPDEPISVNTAARDEVEHLKINANTESSQALNMVSDMPTDNHLLSGEETGERLFTDIHHNGIAGSETPSEVRHAVDSVQTTANAMRTPSVATPQKGSLKQGKSKNLPYAVQKQQLLAAKETYKTLAKTLNGQDKVRLKMYQDAVAQTIAREKADKKMLAWQHYYQYVSARIQGGKLNLPKPIPPEQAKQMMKQLTQSQTQQPKPQMPQPTLSQPRRHKM